MPRFQDDALYIKYLPDKEDARPEIAYPLWAVNFLPVLSETSNVGLACDAAGIDMATFRRYRYGDHENAPTQHPYKGNYQFCVDVNGALDRAVEHLRLVAWKRASKSSDRLLALLLRAHDPELYAPPRVVRHEEDPHVLARVEDMRQRLLARLAPPALPEGEVDGSYKEIP